MSAVGVLGFVGAAVLCWIFGVGGESREFALFISSGVLLAPICAAIHEWVIRPDFRQPRAGTVETVCCWAAIAILFLLASVPFVLLWVGGGSDYWRRFGPVGTLRLVVQAGLGVATVSLPSRGRPHLPDALASRATQVTMFVWAFFASAVALFKIDLSGRHLNLFVRLFTEPPFSESPAPFGLGRAMMLAVLALASVVALAKLETRLVRRHASRLPAARRFALWATALFTVTCFFDFSLLNDPMHYLTNVTPALNVLHGATPMVDTFSQYGVGPVLITLAAFLIGPPTFGAAQMAVQIFNLAFCVVWLVCLYRMSRLKLAALLLGFLSIAFAYAAWAYGYGNLNDSPSLLGLRYLPSLMMVLALSRLSPPHRHSALTAITAFVAGLWSIETLIGTLGVHGAFLGVLSLRDRTVRRLAADAVRAVVPAAAGLLVLTLSILARAGTLPDFWTYLGYLSTYNMLSYPWAVVASPRFFGWMAMLLAILLVSADAWARVFNAAARVTELDDTDLFYRFVPMAILLMLQMAYFVARSIDYTLVLAVLPFCAIAIPASLAFTGVVAEARGFARMLLVIPFALAFWALTFTSLSLFRQHYSVLEGDCPRHTECAAAPYSFLLHECRDHGRCSPAAIGRALAETMHARAGLERVGTPRGDYWFDSTGITRDGVSMIETWAGEASSVTVLLSARTPAEYLSTELALMYTGKRHRWPRSFTFSDELVDATMQRIIAAPDRLREGELVLVRSDEASLGPLEAGILERIRREVTLCRLPHASMQVVAYRVAGPAGCQSL